MGRTERSLGLAPPSQRRNQRAKRARETLNKSIPAILAGSARARAGVQAAQLIVNPSSARDVKSQGRRAGEEEDRKQQKKASRKRVGRRIIENNEEEGGKSSLGGAGVLVDALQETSQAPPQVRILVADTLAAASQSASSNTGKNNVAILNMASPLRAGGGFLNGATSQEEFLCMRTTLYPSLREEFYRLPEVGAVWTSDVLVFRDSAAEPSELLPQQRFWIDVITAGALRFPEIELEWTESATLKEGQEPKREFVGYAFADKKDRDLLKRKMKAICRILHNKGTKKVVLGAWGCGAYGNPVEEVARAWQEVLFGLSQPKIKGRNTSAKDQEKWFGLSEVVFAINQPKMAREFERHWDGDIHVEEFSSITHYEDDEDDMSDRDSQEVEELREKIAQLEAQATAARDPTLKTGLEKVLQKLRNELNTKTEGAGERFRDASSEKSSDDADLMVSAEEEGGP